VLTETAGLLRLRPLGTHRFSEPAGTVELALPAATLVLAVAEGGALGFQGDFSRVGRPDDVVLSPLDPDDAQQIERVLAARLGLPHAPRRVTAAALAQSREWAFVIVEGTYRAGHGDAPNFDALRLAARDLESGRRYRVVGFFAPPELDDVGPTLRPIEITPL